MEDDYNARFRLGFAFSWRAVEDLPVKKQRINRAMRRWLSAGCAAGLICASILASTARAQTAPVAKDNAPKQKAKTSGAKKHSSASAKSKAETAAPAAKARRPSQAAVATKSNTSAAAHGSKSKSASSRKTSRRRTARGQQKIDSERAQAIQEALIREHYLTGQAAGTWNQASEDAMRRYQADHGWQSKTVPDARALISLGLGPSHDHLLNPESAMTTGPFPPRSTSSTPVSHSADPGARLNTNPSAPTAPSPATTPAQDPSSPQ
jgi:hypothetical protein